MTTNPFINRPFYGATDVYTRPPIRTDLYDPVTREVKDIPGEQIAELTNRILAFVGVADDDIKVTSKMGTAIDEVFTETGDSTEDLVLTRPTVTKNTIPDKRTWSGNDTIRFVNEIANEVLAELDKTDPTTPRDQAERNILHRTIIDKLYNSSTGLFGSRKKSETGDFKSGIGDPQYDETSDEFLEMKPVDRSIVSAINQFEDLAKRNGKTRWNLNFKTNRIAQIREELLEQELISPELYEAMKGTRRGFIDDGIQDEAYNILSSLQTNERELTKAILNRSTSYNYRTAVGQYISAANPDDIRAGVLNDVAETLPLSENVIRNQIEQDNQSSMQTAFANNTNLANAVSDILGPIPPTTDDEDKIEKNTRDRLLNYLESYRANIRRDNPNLSDQEVGSFLYSALMDANAPGGMDEFGEAGPSIIDGFRNTESDKVQVVKDKEAAKDYEKLQKEQRAAEEKFRKEQESIAKTQRAWLHTQLDAEDTLYKAAKNKPESFVEDYLEDPSYKGQVDKLIEKYKTQGRPERNADGDIIGYSAPMGMTPSGKFAFFPDITYRDQYTGDIVTIPHSEMNNHLDRMGNRLAYQLQSIYNQSPEDMFNAQTGRGAMPSLPFDPMKFMPQTRKGDMYTTNAMGERIPLYPYADPNEMVGGQAFPSGSVSPEPVSRYDQEVKFKDTVLPPQDQFLETGQEGYFDLGPTEQGPIPLPPEPVEPVSKKDFMALSEPEF